MADHVTPEEARELADDHERDGFAFTARVIRSLAAQLEEAQRELAFWKTPNDNVVPSERAHQAESRERRLREAAQAFVDKPHPEEFEALKAALADTAPQEKP